MRLQGLQVRKARLRVAHPCEDKGQCTPASADLVFSIKTSGANVFSISRSGPDAEARQRVLDQMGDFGPFWS
jgi:hypothetical protein